MKVYAPEGVRPMEEEADVFYRAGEILQAVCKSVHMPGPENIHYGFLLARARGVCFCPDLLMHGKGQLKSSVGYSRRPGDRARNRAPVLDLSSPCFASITAHRSRRHPHTVLREDAAEESGGGTGLHGIASTWTVRVSATASTCVAKLVRHQPLVKRTDYTINLSIRRSWRGYRS